MELRDAALKAAVCWALCSTATGTLCATVQIWGGFQAQPLADDMENSAVVMDKAVQLSS